jgi:glycosyltransferase involved in cell wall biosynthesis
MRIAYISPRYMPYVGGVETHVAHLARRAARQGHAVEVLTQESDRSLPAQEELGGVTVRRFPATLAAHNYTFAPSLWAYLARHSRRYDILHAHSYHALPSLGAALSRHRPLVFTPHYHGTGHSAFRSLLHVPYRLAGRLIFRRASRVICVSEAEARLVCRHFPQVSDRVMVIPNGVDVPALRSAQPYRQDRAVILCVGRLEEYKNVHLAVEAFTHLDDTFALVVIGDGPARRSLEALTERLGLHGRVKFLGRVDDSTAHRWFRTASVYASMSSHEAFGITVREALAAGARVVASDIPAHRDVMALVGPGAVSLVPLDARPAQLARTFRDTSIRTQNSPALMQIASWDVVAEQTLRVYPALVA